MTITNEAKDIILSLFKEHGLNAIMATLEPGCCHGPEVTLSLGTLEENEAFERINDIAVVMDEGAKERSEHLMIFVDENHLAFRDLSAEHTCNHEHDETHACACHHEE